MKHWTVIALLYHEGGHWSAACLFPEEKAICHYDPMLPNDSDRAQKAFSGAKRLIRESHPRSELADQWMTKS